MTASGKAAPSPSPAGPARAAAAQDGVLIQGKLVGWPVVVRDAASASATWLVDAAAARSLLPAADLDVIEILPGRTLFSLACIDYVDNDLGDYNEVSLAFFVRERSASRGLPYVGAALDFLRGRVSTFIFWLPVDQGFTREAGETMWGFPKTVEKIDFDHAGPRAVCTLTAAGKRVLTFSMPKGGKRALPKNPMSTYTIMDEKTCVTRFESESSGVGFFRRDVELTLGNHPVADWLRSLGLPKRPMMAVWMEHMKATFGKPRPL